MTQSQAQARQPGGAANQDPPQSTGPALRLQDVNLNGPARPLFKLYNRPNTGLISAVPEIPLQSNHDVSTQTQNQDTLKFRRIYPNS